MPVAIPAVLPLLALLASSGRGCIPTRTPEYIVDLEMWQELEKQATTSVLLTTVRETTASSSSAAPTTTTTSTSTTTTTTTTTTIACTAAACPMSGGWEYYAGTCSCYHLITPGIVADPNAACDADYTGSNAASISNQAENDWIYNYLANDLMQATTIYIGGFSPTPADMDSWFWLDGSDFDYSNWYLNYTPVGSCMLINANSVAPSASYWANGLCDYGRPVLCKVPAM